MKNAKKVTALFVAAVMLLAMAAVANAATITISSTADKDEANAETTAYAAWMLLNADIGEAPKQDGAAQSGGKIAYYTTSTAAKKALEDAGLFTFTQVGSENKWYANADDDLSAKDITDAFGSWSDAAMTAAFGEAYTGAQTTPGGEAVIEAGGDGYYFVKSTLGDQIAVQTIGEVTISTKNSYPTHEKAIAEEDANAQLGDEISYTLTVNIPSSANDAIVLTDTMDAGLTFKSVDSIKAGDADVAGTVAPNTAAAVTANGNKFTITFDAGTVKANQGETVTIAYTAVLNNRAAVGTAVKNSLVLSYGSNYESVVKEVETETHSFSFNKIDGTDKNQLTGAEFRLQIKDGEVLDLVAVTEGEVYRVATDEDETTVDTIVTAGKTITVNGVDSDVIYQLVETKAPAGGYNKLDAPQDVTVTANNEAHVDVENNRGIVLPSTGGMGTTVFYIIGSILVVGAGIILVARRRAAK